MRDRRSSDAADSSGTDGGGPAPGKRSRSEQLPIQRQAHAAAEPASGGDAFAHATSGAASAVPFRERMEASFGFDFSGVQAHLGGDEARDGLASLGAAAATQGQAVAFADAAPSEHLVAHELAHVVQQQRGGGASVQAKAAQVSEPGDACEVAADAAADAVVAGAPVPDVGTAHGATIHRSAVATSGGTWTTPRYQPLSAKDGKPGREVGALMELQFTPNGLVEAPDDGIGLVQTVKATRTHAGSDAPAEPYHGADPGKEQLWMDEADAVPGLALDRRINPKDANGPGGKRAIPNTSPIYGVENNVNVADDLNDGEPRDANQRGSRAKQDDGTFAKAEPAVLIDSPDRTIKAQGDQFQLDFEVTALVTAGPLANTYLGSVGWGWHSDAHGKVTLAPNPITVVSTGAPTEQFMLAAETWNDAQFTNLSTGTVHGSVDLPIVNGPRPADLTTPELLKLIKQTHNALDREAFELELRSRNVLVEVWVEQLQEHGHDEICAVLAGPHGSVRSATRSMARDQLHTFRVPFGKAAPLGGPLKVRLIEEDWPDDDDQLLTLDWTSPFHAITGTGKNGGGVYHVGVSVER